MAADSAKKLVRVVTHQKASFLEPLDLAGAHQALPPKQKSHAYRKRLGRQDSRQFAAARNVSERGVRHKHVFRKINGQRPQFNQISSFGWKTAGRTARERAIE